MYKQGEGSRKGSRSLTGGMNMILLIDNYDSFSYNLYQLIGAIDPDIKVIRNDELSCEEVLALSPSHIIISPGPGRPSDAGICEELVIKAEGKVPILGVCLGHQAIAEHFGARIFNMPDVCHGIGSEIRVTAPDYIFDGMPQTFRAGRYHSWAVDDTSLPDGLEVTARSADGVVMGLRHRSLDVHGVQFHPESILTPEGIHIFANFLNNR